jgi:glutathione S-transferase
MSRSCKKPRPVLTLSQGNARSTALKAVAKANKLELEIVDDVQEGGVKADYLLLNKLGKVPTFQGSDGYVLSECIAIAIYRMYPTTYLLLFQEHPFTANSRSRTFYDEKYYQHSYPCLKTTC